MKRPGWKIRGAGGLVRDAGSGIARMRCVMQEAGFSIHGARGSHQRIGPNRLSRNTNPATHTTGLEIITACRQPRNP